LEGVTIRDPHCDAEEGTQIVRAPGRGIGTPCPPIGATLTKPQCRHGSSGPRAALRQLRFCNPQAIHGLQTDCIVDCIAKQARATSALTCAFTGGGEGSRTPDTGIFSPLLYQLSYPAKGLLLQARLLYQTPRKGQRQSLQCRENHRGTRGDALGAACWPFLSTGIALRARK
jgi:hypothetical protein